MLAMIPRTPLGVRRSALSFTTIASRLAPTGFGVINCHQTAYYSFDIPRYNLDALFTIQIV